MQYSACPARGRPLATARRRRWLATADACRSAPEGNRPQALPGDSPSKIRRQSSVSANRRTRCCDRQACSLPGSAIKPDDNIESRRRWPPRICSQARPDGNSAPQTAPSHSGTGTLVAITWNANQSYFPRCRPPAQYARTDRWRSFPSGPNRRSQPPGRLPRRNPGN